MKIWQHTWSPTSDATGWNLFRPACRTRPSPEPDLRQASDEPWSVPPSWVGFKGAPKGNKHRLGGSAIKKERTQQVQGGSFQSCSCCLVRIPTEFCQAPPHASPERKEPAPYSLRMPVQSEETGPGLLLSFGFSSLFFLVGGGGGLLCLGRGVCVVVLPRG